MVIYPPLSRERERGTIVRVSYVVCACSDAGGDAASAADGQTMLTLSVKYMVRHIISLSQHNYVLVPSFT